MYDEVMKTCIIGATEFKAKCLALLDEIEDQGGTITVTKRGRPAAVVVSHAEWTKLKTRAPSFADLLLAVPPVEPKDLPARRPARVVRKGRFK